MINRRNIILFIPLFLVITFPLWKIPVASFLTPRGGGEENTVQHSGETTHDFAMEHITILQNQNGKKTATIRAARALTGTNKNEFLLELVNADILDKNNEITNIVAELGTYNMETKLLILENNVLINRVAGNQKMMTDYMIYSDADRTIKSPGRTEFIGEAFNIVGGKMDYNIETEQYVLSKRVFCVIGGFIEQ